MTPEVRDSSNQSSESLLPQYQERFKALNKEIINALNPRDRLIVFSTDSEDSTKGYHFSIDKEGYWREGFGDCCPGIVDSNFSRILSASKYYRSLVLEPLTEIEMGSIAEHQKKRISAWQNLNDVAPGFLDNMQKALKRYQENPN